MSPSRYRRTVRAEVDEPGLRASAVADVNVAVATSGSSSSRSTVRVQQRSGRTTRARQDAGTPASDSARPQETP